MADPPCPGIHFDPMNNDPTPAVRIRRLSKAYGATLALQAVDLDIAAGSVHALVGENGAGKSTCLGAVAGRVSPSSGTIEVFGEQIRSGHPREIKRMGVGAIYQELSIVGCLSTEANVFLGHEERAGYVLQGRQMAKEFMRLCDSMEVVLPVGRRADSLSVADNQLLEIMRALVGEPRVLLFDEPTSALGQPERESLFRIIGSLRDRGLGIVVVSHNLDEVLANSDEVTVFRNGSVVRSAPAVEWTKPALVEAMLGHEAAAKRSRSRRPLTPAGTTPLLDVRDLHIPGAVGPLSFQLMPGEVLGIGGLVGSGRSSVLRALAGADPLAGGTIAIDGREAPIPTDPRAALRLGLSMIPEDRKAAGLVDLQSAAENIVLSGYGRVSSYGFLSSSAVRAAAAGPADGVALEKRYLDYPAAALSGGNQQKLLFARCSYMRPKVLLADEPTRGVDVGAKETLLATVLSMAEEGVAVVFVSSDLEEVVEVADRVLVLTEGRIAGELDASATVDGILHLAFRSGAQPEVSDVD